MLVSESQKKQHISAVFIKVATLKYSLELEDIADSQNLMG